MMISKWFNQHMEPFHFLAYMTDPKYFGAQLTSEQEDVAESWINENYPNFIPSLRKLKIKDTESCPGMLFSENINEQFTGRKEKEMEPSKG